MFFGELTGEMVKEIESYDEMEIISFVFTPVNESNIV